MALHRIRPHELNYAMDTNEPSQPNAAAKGRVEGLLQLLVDVRALLQQARAVNPDWQELLGAEAAFRIRLESLLASPVPSNEVEAVRIALQEMLALNHVLVDLIEGHRARAVQALEHKALVRRAANAYSQSAIG